jgi:transcriptional regulator with XRE-family HTH domain
MSTRRIRRKRPGPLAAIIGGWLQEHNKTYRDLAEATRELAQATSPDDEGVSWAMIGSIIRGETREPTPRNLWLLAHAMGVTPADLLLALGYDPSDFTTRPETAERQRVLALVRAAPDEDVRRVDRVLGLDDRGRDALDALLAATEGRLRG